MADRTQAEQFARRVAEGPWRYILGAQEVDRFFHLLRSDVNRRVYKFAEGKAGGSVHEQFFYGSIIDHAARFDTLAELAETVVEAERVPE